MARVSPVGKAIAKVAATQQAPAKAQRGPRKAVDVPKQHRLSPLIRAACTLYIEEEGITLTEIGNRLGCSRTYLSRTFQKEHVIAHLARERRKYLLGDAAQNHAARVYRGLLKSESDAIKRDVAERLLTAGETLPSDTKGAKGVSVQVGVQVGYVVNWQPQEPVVDVTPKD